MASSAPTWKIMEMRYSGEAPDGLLNRYRATPKKRAEDDFPVGYGNPWVRWSTCMAMQNQNDLERPPSVTSVELTTCFAASWPKGIGRS